MLYIGIDPGLSGAIALFDSDFGPIVEDMPTMGKIVDGGNIANFFTGRDYKGRCHAFIEDVHSMPKQGVSSSFCFGRSFGTVIGVLAALEIPITFVSPQRWKKLFGLNKDKAASRRRAIELFPALAGDLKRVKDDGRAEALLIAEYGRRTLIQ